MPVFYADTLRCFLGGILNPVKVQRRDYMSNFRRITATALVLLMILAACSSSPEVPPDFGTEIKGDDFNGVALTFLTDPYVCYDPDSLFGDLAKARVADVCKKYNVNIEFNEDTDIVYDLILCVSSGIKPCDVLFGDPVLLRGQMRAGVMFPVDTFETGLDYLDSEKWGGREQLMGYDIFTESVQCYGPKRFTET